MNLAAHELAGAMPLGKLVTAPHVAPAGIHGGIGRHRQARLLNTRSAHTQGGVGPSSSSPRSLKYAIVVVELATSALAGLPLHV